MKNIVIDPAVHRRTVGYGRTPIVPGVVLVVLGLLRTLGARIGLGRLPGEIIVQNVRTTFSFPVVTCLVLSVLPSLVLRVMQAPRRRGQGEEPDQGSAEGRS